MEFPDSQLIVRVPIAAPTAERMEEIFREECARVAAERLTWFDFAGAAEYLRMSLRTFERRKAQWHLPVAELSPTLKIVYRADLDVLALNHLLHSPPACEKCGGSVIIPFPSIERKRELQCTAEAQRAQRRSA